MTAFTLLFVDRPRVAVTDWRDRVDDLLYAGEHVSETVGLPAGRLVVTTHRVLAFTPDDEGANFRAVDRPNVEGVRLSADGSRRYLRWTLRPLLLGALLVVAGTQLDLGDPLAGVDTSGAGATGAGGILSSVSSFTSLLAMLDDIMIVLGAVCLLAVALLLGAYLYSRERRLVVAVAGDDDVSVPVSGDRSGTVSRLEAALAADDVSAVPDDGGGGGSSPAESTTEAESDDDSVRTVDDVLGGDGGSVEDPTVPFEPNPSTVQSGDDDVSGSERSDAGDEGK